ncbi:MAG: DNA-directed RNA polymerase sigma-70 factor [Chloroflexota bacterium]|nr:MAG: DNA-directed RNA polymerase sigma-70 factor [Chloroflexota bacterium]
MDHDETIDQLVAAARAGDADACAALFDHFHERVYRYVASRVRNPADAEDLTQTIFVKVLEALPRYEERGIPFGGWLFRLARNAIIDHIRTSRVAVDLSEVSDRPADAMGPDDVAGLREDIDRVSAALAELTDDQREVIALRFFAGLSAREAAVAMGRQEGTIRGLQFRAIAALRRRLGLSTATGEPDPGAEAGEVEATSAADGVGATEATPRARRVKRADAPRPRTTDQ